ncbi:cyclin dependent kinase 16 [Echinococcus multilocularis]|uniref:Cyclin dependent kinase 16 n=1 Tax=Echinococcus multilocularis TaxID=6211 RepID=A0A087W148_ECHMU|nr:cyclin dependent kinase 16 [Echinococcus multilocularis]
MMYAVSFGGEGPTLGGKEHYQKNMANHIINPKAYTKSSNFSREIAPFSPDSGRENDLAAQYRKMNFRSQPNTSRPSRRKKLNPKPARGLGNLNTVDGPPDPTFLEEVGSGTYSVVYKCKLEANGPILAAKVMKMNPSEGAPGTAIREASILKLLKHDNIVTLHEIIYKPGKLTLVFEYIEDNLSNYMGKHDLPKDSAIVQRFSSHLFQGLAYIHKMNILHRDLKPENTLITSNGILKIADFGMARQKFLPTCDMEIRVATLRYKPPEILLTGCKYDFGIDIWSAGCIIYEMMNGEVLFKGTDFVTQICKIFQILGVPPQSYWPELRLNQTFQVIQGNLEESYPATTLQTYDIKTPLRDRFTHPSNRHWRENAAAFSLLEACLQPRESKRITAEDALKMDFLAGCVAPSKIDQAYSLRIPKPSDRIGTKDLCPASRADKHRIEMRDVRRTRKSQSELLSTAMEGSHSNSSDCFQGKTQCDHQIRTWGGSCGSSLPIPLPSLSTLPPQDSTRCNNNTKDSRDIFKPCLRTSLSSQPPPQLPQRNTRKGGQDACLLSSVSSTPSSGSGVTSYRRASPPPIPPRVRSHHAITAPSGLSKSMERS